MSKVIRVDFRPAPQRRMERQSDRMGRNIAAVQLEIDRALDKVDCLLSVLKDSAEEQ